MPYDIWNLSSARRDQSPLLALGAGVFTSELPGKSSSFLFNPQPLIEMMKIQLLVSIYLISYCSLIAGDHLLR